MNIRPARETDYHALCELWRQLDVLHARLQPEFFAGLGQTRRPLDGLRRTLRHRRARLLVAEETVEGTVLVGLVRVQVSDTPADPDERMRVGRRAYVDEMVVDAAWRKRGVGRALFVAARDWAQTQGAQQLLLTVWAGNDAADAFYRRLGLFDVNRVLGLSLR